MAIDHSVKHYRLSIILYKLSVSVPKDTPGYLTNCTLHVLKLTSQPLLLLLLVLILLLLLLLLLSTMPADAGGGAGIYIAASTTTLLPHLPPPPAAGGFFCPQDSDEVAFRGVVFEVVDCA